MCLLLTFPPSFGDAAHFRHPSVELTKNETSASVWTFFSALITATVFVAPMMSYRNFLHTLSSFTYVKETGKLSKFFIEQFKDVTLKIHI